jgi:hypothetical protein
MNSEPPADDPIVEGTRLDPDLVERVRQAYQGKLEAVQAWGLSAGLSPAQNTGAAPLATIRKVSRVRHR